MMGKRSRDKGAAYERDRAIALRELYPDARRGLGQARSAGEVCDVEGTPFWNEAKKHRNVSIQAAMKQAIAATDGRPPVVLSQDDRGEHLVTMRFADWLEMARDSHDLRAVCVKSASAAELGAAFKAAEKAAQEAIDALEVLP